MTLLELSKDCPSTEPCAECENFKECCYLVEGEEKC
jgi:hypothetical protein